MDINRQLANIQRNETKIYRNVDKFLKFMQTPVRHGNGSFRNIAAYLELVAHDDTFKDRKNKALAREAEQLRKRLIGASIIYDFDKYTKFNKLTDINFSDTNLKQVYIASEEIVRDINVARNWISDYKDFEKKLAEVNNYQDSELLHEQLMILGKSILGRSLELCPIDTGFLRSTGTLLDFGDHIVIAFLAPYASYVHENLEISHPWHMDKHGLQRNCGGRAKFLELAVQEAFPDRNVWVENHGYEGVMVEISINPLLIEYSHYD